VLRWRENGFKEGGPFADDHARAIISGANNPPTTTRAVVVPLTRVEVPKPEPKVVHLQILREPPKAPVDYSEEVATAMPVLQSLARLEQVATELTTEVELYGGIVGVGKDVERRIMAVVNKLWSSANHPPVRRSNW
jgi:hypothetical protein